MTARPARSSISSAPSETAPFRASYASICHGKAHAPRRAEQKAHVGHEQRTAQVDLRYLEVEFRPPSHHPEKKVLKLWVVHVVEPSPPADAEPVEWFLLTTCTIKTSEQAQECLRWYR